MESPHPTLLVPTHLFKIVLVIDSRREAGVLHSPQQPHQPQPTPIEDIGHSTLGVIFHRILS